MMADRFPPSASAHYQIRREPHQHSGEQHTNNNGKNDLPLAHTQEVSQFHSFLPFCAGYPPH